MKLEIDEIREIIEAVEMEISLGGRKTTCQSGPKNQGKIS